MRPILAIYNSKDLEIERRAVSSINTDSIVVTIARYLLCIDDLSMKPKLRCYPTSLFPPTVVYGTTSKSSASCS
jgi:hypothetical protein